MQCSPYKETRCTSSERFTTPIGGWSKRLLKRKRDAIEPQHEHTTETRDDESGQTNHGKKRGEENTMIQEHETRREHLGQQIQRTRKREAQETRAEHTRT